MDLDTLFCSAFIALNLADDITALLVECQSSINLLVIALATHSQTSLALLSILSDKLYI